MGAFYTEIAESVGDSVRCSLRWVLCIPSMCMAHPANKGITYGEHLRQAWYMAFRMGYGSVCLLLHGIFPFMYETTGTRTVKRLYREIHDEEERAKERDKERIV